MTDDPFLTDEQVEDLTGYVQPKRQAAWLSENGIKAYTNARGKVRVPREAIAGRLQIASKSKRTAPDFTKVQRAS